MCLHYSSCLKILNNKLGTVTVNEELLYCCDIGV